jgi:hypothetical protein
MQMDVKTGGRAEALDERDRIGLTLAIGILVLLCAGTAIGTSVISRVRSR